MVERPERTAASLHPTSHPNGRGLPDNPSQGRRPVPNSAATSNGPPPPPPIPNSRSLPSSSSLSSNTAMNPAQVITMVREAMRNALETEVEGKAVGTGIQAGVTLDLSRKNIQKLPEEVIDLMKTELERLALSHNQLTSLPARFSECTSLRYLNIRGNQFREFPTALCDLKSLEILDLGRNQLRVLPSDISRLSSLKVLSVPKNQIRELPVCLADMGSLQVLKFEGNPISFPPRDALRVQSSSPGNEGLGISRDIEITEVVRTAQIKKYLRQHTMNERSDMDGTGDESSEAGDTPRFPLKRVTSGRFPIKVNGADPPDARSPSAGRAPPIPSRSHYRGLSQQSTAIRRPGVMPLTISSINERTRSNSETQMRSGDLRERSESRNRRMGMVSRKPSDLGTLEESDASNNINNSINRLSHYRGLSHGSAMQGPQIGVKTPSLSAEPYLQRPIYFRRLSVLPERKRESKIFDPVVEAAKGILYSVFQIHPMIQMLMSLSSDGSVKRSSLEIVFYNTNSHVEELEREIQRYDAAINDVDMPATRENENVHRACQTLVSAYGHVCTLLADNIDTFVDNGDARYIRTLLVLIYNSVMELRVTLSTVSAQDQRQNVAGQSTPGDVNTIRPHTQHPTSTGSITERPFTQRGRNGTVLNNPANLRVAVNVPVPPSSGGLPTALLGSATPRSGESFSSATSRTGLGDFSEEDAQFERVFLSLRTSVELVLRVLPNFHFQISGRLRSAAQKPMANALMQDWKNLISTCANAIKQTEMLKSRLSVIKLKEPGVRSQSNFWNLCSNFIWSWYDMARQIKDADNKVPLPPDTRSRLRPVQKSMKETSNTIAQSPWQHVLGSTGAGGSGMLDPNMASPTITPQSAALGPAMQATVPITPQSASFASAFQGNVFDRADALLANPGISMSRTGTLSRGHSGFNSLSSISSMSSDGNSGPSSVASPSNSFGPMPLRLNSGKAQF